MKKVPDPVSADEIGDIPGIVAPCVACQVVTATLELGDSLE